MLHMLAYQGVQVGKITGNSALEGIYSDNGRLYAIGLQQYYMSILVLQ